MGERAAKTLFRFNVFLLLISRYYTNIRRTTINTLYLVATPIGNLEDITLRALRVLGNVRLIAAEDTRYSRRLLNHYNINTPTISYHEHNKLARLDAILQALKEGDVALVSDAGTPAINDPGYELVVEAINAGHLIVPIPGAAAPIAALVASGLPTDRWTFIGFLPNRASVRRSLLTDVANIPATLICFETPHRLRAALVDILAVLGDRRIVAARELTKLHEEFVRGTVKTLQEHFMAHEPRGEFTLIIDRDIAPHQQHPLEEDEWKALAQQQLVTLANSGVSGAAAVKQVAKNLNIARHDVYKLWNELRDEI